MKRTRMKAKDGTKELVEYGIQLSKKDKVELVETNTQMILVINDTPAYFYYQDHILPTLKTLQEAPFLLKQITVDMGAVKFVVNGADIMRPGIREVEEGIEQDSFIVIVDENNKKPLAIGIAQLNTQDLRAAQTGKVIKNIHHVGDELWNLQV